MSRATVLRNPFAPLWRPARCPPFLRPECSLLCAQDAGVQLEEKSRAIKVDEFSHTNVRVLQWQLSGALRLANPPCR